LAVMAFATDGTLFLGMASRYIVNGKDALFQRRKRICPR
jgi:hypothetical protein